MRNLVLLRGAPASGKSTWIANNNLQQYTLSADGLRLLWQTPIMKISGKMAISQNNDGEVWGLLFHLLEQKMKRGELCIVDATHYKSELLNRYKPLAQRYRYRIHIVDFTNIPLDELKRRNNLRPEHMVVPEDVLEKMYKVFTMEAKVKQLKKSYDVKTPDEAIKFLNDQSLLIDWSSWEKIVVFGDIHGCYEPLEKYFAENPEDPKVKYVFTGDYLDRGIQNREVMEFLLRNYEKPNFYFLTGNHERWLERYAFKEDQIKLPASLESLREFLPGYLSRYLQYATNHSQEFDTNTKPQLEGIPLEDIRQFCRKLGQMAYFKYYDKVFTITHGGITNLPSIRIATSQYIQGVGKYGDIESVQTAWAQNTSNEHIQIHAHRNIFSAPVNQSERNYNLCDNIEYGGNLRVLEITKYGIEWKLIKNNTFSEELTAPTHKSTSTAINTKELLHQLNHAQDIKRKALGDGITAYNFTRDVFNKGSWTDTNIRARGLFLRGDKVVARGYDKFFNICETKATEWPALQKTFQFPVYAFQKENGFLGLMSWDKETSQLFIASKSTNKGDFADMFRAIWEKYPESTKDKIAKYLQENDVSLVWEVIDPQLDPHIIEYSEKTLVLLDVIDNTLEHLSVKSYPELIQLSGYWNVTVKKLSRTFSNFSEFKFFISQISQSKDMKTEGFVFRDVNNFQVKFKTPYYKFWKRMRQVLDSVIRGSEIKQTFVDAKEVDTVLHIRALGAENLKGMSIIDVRKLLEKPTNSI